jgi:hypothetical protein
MKYDLKLVGPVVMSVSYKRAGSDPKAGTGDADADPLVTDVDLLITGFVISGPEVKGWSGSDATPASVLLTTHVSEEVYEELSQDDGWAGWPVFPAQMDLQVMIQADDGKGGWQVFDNERDVHYPHLAKVLEEKTVTEVCSTLAEAVPGLKEKDIRGGVIDFLKTVRVVEAKTRLSLAKNAVRSFEEALKAAEKEIQVL